VPRRVVWPWRPTTTRLLVRHPSLRTRSTAWPHSRFSEELDRQGGASAPSSRPRRTPAAPGATPAPALVLAGLLPWYPGKPATTATLIRRAREVGPLPHGTRPASLHWVHDVFGNCVAVARFADRAVELRFECRIYLAASQIVH
jgi:hypothetical protein